MHCNLSNVSSLKKIIPSKLRVNINNVYEIHEMNENKHS